MTSAIPLAEARDRARKLLEGLLTQMGFEATVDAREQGEDEVLLQIASPDASRLIGRQAQMLESIQHVLNLMLRTQQGPGVHCVVDIELYRERRKDRLLKEAFDAAEIVRRTGREYVLPPLAAQERRIVHQALKTQEDLETVSREPDEEGRKCIAIRLRAEAAPAPEAGPEAGPAPV